MHVLTRERSAFGRLLDIESKLVRWTGNLTDRPAVERCLRGAEPEVIFHLAGNTSGRHFQGDWASVEPAIADNFVATLSLLRAAAESGVAIRSVIRTGGLEEYGGGATPYVEAQREQPRSPYSASQVAATHWCQMLQPSLPFAVVTLRPALIYGPAQSADFLIPALIASLLRGKRFHLTDGTQARDLLYVDDFVRAMLLAAGADASALRGAILNISTGQEYLIRDVARRVASALAAESLLDVGTHPTRAGELVHLVAANAEAKCRLGWQPEVDLDEGLQRTIAWYRAEHSA